MVEDKKVSILIFLNDDDISGVKVNNRVFYRCEGEEIVSFFNDKLIPTLKKYDNIDFASYYRKDNITMIPELDYNLDFKDIVTVSDKEKGNIILTKNFTDLFDNQKIYVFRTYENKFNDIFNFKHPTDYYEKVRLELMNELDEICSDCDDVKKTLLDYFDEEVVDYIIELDNSKLFDIKPSSETGVILFPQSFRIISSNIDEIISFSGV